MKRAISTPKAKLAPISQGPKGPMLGRFGNNKPKQFWVVLIGPLQILNWLN